MEFFLTHGALMKPNLSRMMFWITPACSRRRRPCPPPPSYRRHRRHCRHCRHRRGRCVPPPRRAAPLSAMLFCPALPSSPSPLPSSHRGCHYSCCHHPCSRRRRLPPPCLDLALFLALTLALAANAGVSGAVQVGWWQHQPVLRRRAAWMGGPRRRRRRRRGRHRRLTHCGPARACCPCCSCGSHTVGRRACCSWCPSCCSCE